VITFDGIGTALVPGSRVEFSNARAISGLPAAPQKILLTGMRLAGGSVAQLVPVRIISADQAAVAFGRGSMLHGMCAASLFANPTTETWAIAQDANAAGTAAVWTITLTGPASAAGTLAYLIAGQKVQAGVASGDSATAMAAALTAAINAAPDLPLTATSAAGVVTLTARHKGTYGNDFDIRANHYEGEALPAGVTSTVAVSVAGTTNPDLTAVWAAIGDEQYRYIALGCNDATNLTAADTELNARWSPAKQREGRAFAVLSGNFSTCAAFGATRNGIHTTVIGAYKVPTPTWKMAAAFAAIAAFHLAIDPARPLTDLVVPGVIAPQIPHRFTRTEREQLLATGISTFRVNSSGEVAIERLISSYLVNSFNFPDPSYRDITTTATLGYLRFSWRSVMAAKFPRVKLTEDVIASIKAETIALARDWFDAGLIEDVEGFIAGLVIERDGSNVNQLNLLLTPNVVNPLLQLAARIEFIL